MQKYFLEKVINIGSIVVSVKKRKKKKRPHVFGHPGLSPEARDTYNEKSHNT